MDMDAVLERQLCQLERQLPVSAAFRAAYRRLVADYISTGSVM